MAGKQWKAWSSRVVSACLQMGEASGGRLHVVSCYALTRAARREVKDAFFQELDHIFASVPSGEKYVVLSDFNAHIGSREHVGDHWDAMRGLQRYGVINDAGRELLSFLSVHQATVCNRWLRKKAIHQQTWQHPKLKQWSCIDYVLTRQKDRKICLDVAVKRGAECNTDHQFVYARLRMAGCGYRRKAYVNGKGTYDVSKLVRVRQGDYDGSDQLVMEEFQEEVVERARAVWPEEGMAENKWTALRTVQTDAADSWLGRVKGYQPDWFQESLNELKAILRNRNDAYIKWLAMRKREDLVQFKEAGSVARKAIRQVKNAWFQANTDETQKQHFGGKVVWKCIWDLQRACRGLVPSKAITISDESGKPYSTPVSQQQHWRRHFTKVLNVRYQYQPAKMEKVRQREVDEDLGKTPSSAEVTRALGTLKNGKAPRSSDILPEMLKVGRRNEDYMRLIMNLVEAVWKETRVP